MLLNLNLKRKKKFKREFFKGKIWLTRTTKSIFKYSNLKYNLIMFNKFKYKFSKYWIGLFMRKCEFLNDYKFSKLWKFYLKKKDIYNYKSLLNYQKKKVNLLFKINNI